MANSQDNTAETLFLRHLIDVVWGYAMEDGQVPSTLLADKMIAHARHTLTSEHSQPPRKAGNYSLKKLKRRGGGRFTIFTIELCNPTTETY